MTGFFPRVTSQVAVSGIPRHGNKGAVFTNKLNQPLILFGLCVLCLLFSGCATMFSRGEDQITIKSDPEGADVYEGANLLGKTPLIHKFNRETFKQKKLTIRKAGYKSQELRLQKVLARAALLNFGFILTSYGVTSWGIDAASGNMMEYSPDSYFIELKSEENSTSQKDDLRRQRLRFVLLNQHELLENLAEGDGEYLRAFFEIREPEQSIDNYEQFLSQISAQAILFLRLNEPEEFYNELEKNLYLSGKKSGES